MASSATTETITTACACRKFNLTVQFPTSSLPVNRALCLCNGCRRLSGSCSNSYIALPSSVSSALDLSSFSLSSYKSSEDLERYFCSTCGAHVLFRRITAGFWALSTGLWDSTEDVIRWTGCKWVEDTLDGGISVWLSSITDKDGSKRELKRWKLNDVGGELMPEGSLIIPPRAKEKDEKLTAQCRCGGVKFHVTRPNEESKTVHSPFPDLMIPYHTGASSANPQNETWFLRNNATRYLAGTCTCTSCRRASGFEIQTWAFIPKCNIFQENGNPLDWNMGTLKRYESSKGVWREFCGTCSATIFWHNSEREELIDVSAGLFDPEEGARCEAWLEWWTERVSFKELAVSRSLVESLEEGLKDWGEKRAGKL